MRSEEEELSASERTVAFYREHPIEAMRDLLGIDPIWYQRKVLRALWTKPFVLLNMGRGSSKTSGCGWFSILKCMLFPKTKIGVIAPVFRQANFMFDEIETIWNDSPFFKASAPDGIRRGTASTIIKFPGNGSYIEALPIGNDGGKVRGRRYTTVIIDEYAVVDDEIVKLVIRPMLNIKLSGRENQFIIASTAYYKWNHFWGSYCHYHRKQIEEPDKYAVLEYDYRDIMMVPDAPFQVDEEIIKMQFADMTPEKFAMECLSIFPDEGHGFFTSRLIEACTPKADKAIRLEVLGDPSARYVLGIDCAREPGGDNFAIAIIKLVNRTTELIYLETLNGETYQVMANTIRRKLRDYNIIRIANDHGGGGQTLRDLLREPWKDIDNPSKDITYPAILELEPEDELDAERPGLRILDQVKITNELNNQMFNDLKSEMHHKRFSLPVDLRRHDDAELERIGKDITMAKTEMMALQTTPSTQGLKFEAPSPYKKDRVTAIVLAMKAALDILRAENDLPVPDSLPVGFWIETQMSSVSFEV